MTSSFLENKISDLKARLQAEKEAVDKDSEEGNHFAGSRPGSGRRPKLLVDVNGTPPRTRKLLDLPGSNFGNQQWCLPHNIGAEASLLDHKMKEIMKVTGIITIEGVKYKSTIDDLELLGELGNGTCGHVVKMLHRPSQRVIAVKQMRRSGNAEENKRIATDLEVVLMCHGCEYIVHCLGCFVTESDVWICMELMGSCFDKLIKRCVTHVPEPILGKVTVATVKALNYLKEKHGVMHRDVKPSNILIDERGNVKLCDFGISGRLVDSKAKSMNAGCTAYMSPERINPADPSKPDYDIRADVWSLGITLVELATGVFPYPDCKSDFEVLSRVMQDDPPCLPHNLPFSQEFRHFVQLCLVKDYKLRPKYRELLEHPFIKRYECESVDVAAWYACATSPMQHSTSPRCDVVKQCSCGFSHGCRLTSKDRSASGSSKNKAAQDWEKLKGVWNTIVKSPLFNRRRKKGDKEDKSNKGEEQPSRPPVSPLLIQRYLHQQMQHITSVRPFGSPSTSPQPSPMIKNEQINNDQFCSAQRERRGSSMSPLPKRTDNFRHSTRNYSVSPSSNWLVRSKSLADRTRSDSETDRSVRDQESNLNKRLQQHFPNWRYDNMNPDLNHSGESSSNGTDGSDFQTEMDRIIRDLIDLNVENSQSTNYNYQQNSSGTNEPPKEKTQHSSNNGRVNDSLNIQKQDTRRNGSRRMDYNINRDRDPVQEEINQRMMDLFELRLSDSCRRGGGVRQPPNPSVSGFSPEPPPRINKRVSPLLARRIAYNSRLTAHNAPFHYSPSTPRRHNFPYTFGFDQNETSFSQRSSSLPCSPILSRNYNYNYHNYFPPYQNHTP